MKVNRYGADLATDDMLRIADKINESKVPAVQLTGGEVFLRPDLLAILGRLSKDVKIGVATNGSYISSDVARVLAQRDAFVSISIDHIDPILNSITRKGSETDLLLNNVRILVNSGVRIGISTVVTRSNYRDLGIIADSFCHQGVKSWKAIVLSDLGEASDSGMYASSALSYSEQEKLMEEIFELRKHYQSSGFEVKVSITPFPTFYEKFGLEKDQGTCCYCAYVKGIIKHDGGFVPCDSIRYPEDYQRNGFSIPSVLEGESINTIFRDSLLFRYWAVATAGVVPMGCGNCAYFERCRGYCRGKSMVAAGKPSGIFGMSSDCARNAKLRFEHSMQGRTTGVNKEATT